MKSHCFEILLATGQATELPMVVLLVGDDSFLRKESVSELLKSNGLDIEQTRTFDGDECSWCEVHDELASYSLFDTNSRRIAIVSSGDKLLKEHRDRIEKWCDSPAESSLLIMQLSSLPATTRLHKIVDKSGWIVLCGLPMSGNGKSTDIGKVRDWIGKWADRKHGLKLKSAQATLILEAVGPHCGMLHQELAKLALYADTSGVLADEVIRTHVGTWATRTVWEISDAIMDGRVAFALEQLHHVFSSGEAPQSIVPQIAWSLRRYGHAAQLVQQSRRMGKPLTADQVVNKAGFWGNDLKLAPQRLRRIGLDRATKILAWLLELDLKLKGSHSNTHRAVFALEELCMRFV